MLNETYITEDDDEYQIKLKPGLTEAEIEQLALQLPAQYIPAEIRELLQFARGFEFVLLDNIDFDGAGLFGLEEFFPHSIQLAGDGFGNFWIVDIDSTGNWGHVFFVSHDPAVIVKQSEDLTQFIEHIQEFAQNERTSNLYRVRERIVFDIWEKKDGFIDYKTAKNSNDPVLKNFSELLSDRYVIADLRNQPIRTGFAWGKFGPNISKTIRHSTELLWGIEKDKSLLSKILKV